MFYLVRHGEANYSEKGSKIFKGYGENFAPLTDKGINQAKELAKDLRLRNSDIIISSPYTRAVQTAAILSKELCIDIIIETNLYEWLADKNFNCLNTDMTEKYFKEFINCNGDYPNGVKRSWEDNLGLKKRLLESLEKYKSFSKVIVVTHGFLIHSVFQDRWLEILK